MFKHRFRVLLIICVIMLSMMQIVSAEEEQGLTAYNTRLITSDKEVTFIEGEVPVANGQTIILRDGITSIAEKKMPDTGQKSSFRIKVPASVIEDEDVKVLFLEERKDGRALSKHVRIEVEYIEKQKQQISADSKEYDMTYPGYDDSIKAEASSGDKLMYISSNPDIAEVDENGNIVPKSGGEVEVLVKQIGNSEYEGTEEKIKVNVEAIDAYTVTFHSSDDEEETTKQIIESTKAEPLESNSFENGEHKFLGWATEDGGLVEYHDSDEVQDLAEKGENADLYAVWTGDGAAAAVAWAIDIANDDSFTYGNKPAANALGCYFCGTNRRNKPKGYEKTYVCLTFVGAAYAHGAEDPEIYYACSHNKMPLYENNNNFTQFSCWTKVGSCRSLSIDDLEPGDVLINWSDHNDNSGHACIYAGGDMIVESTGGGFTAKSISLKSGAAARLKAYRRDGKNYVMRYTGVNAQN